MKDNHIFTADHKVVDGVLLFRAENGPEHCPHIYFSTLVPTHMSRKVSSLPVL